MNERFLKELVRESNLDVYGLGKERYRWEYTVEKFAELIVQECLGCCEQVISDPVPESVDTWLNGGSQCINEIKQHFGVE